jgi:hypothetical protein
MIFNPPKQFAASQWALTALAGVVFLSITAWVFTLLESDGAPSAVRGISFGDGLAMMVSARVKYIYGTWARPFIDEPQHIMLPLHNLLIFWGFKLFGLTLTGMRLFSFVFMTAGKAALAGLACWQLGKNRLWWVLVLLALYFPLNEASLMANPEVVQSILIIFSAMVLLSAGDKQSYCLYCVSGVLLGLAFIYKTNFFWLPLYPAIYYCLSHWWRSQLGASPNLRTLICCYSGFLSVLLFYFLVWIIPNLEEFLWILLRTEYVGLTGLKAFLIRIKDPLLLYIDIEPYFTSANLPGLMAILLVTPLLLLLAPKSLKRVDIAWLSLLFVTAWHSAISLPAWRKEFIVLPLSVWAIIRLIDLISSPRTLKITHKSIVGWLVGVYCLWAIIRTMAWNFDFDLGPNWTGLACLLATLPLGFILHYFGKHKPLWLSGFLALVLLITLPGALIRAYHFFSSPTYQIKEQSIAMGKKVGTARVYGGYNFQLYNRAESYYLSSWTGGLKPIGYRWAESQGLSVGELASKYKFRSSKALLLWLAEQLFPGFWRRWSLQPEDSSRYHSNLILTPPKGAMTPSPRYLVVGANEPNVYITAGWAHLFAELTNKIPKLGPEVMKLQMPQRIPEKQSEAVGLHRVVGWQIKTK